MVDPRDLHDALQRYFSTGELRTLCFDLGIEYEDLEGSTKSGKALALVKYAQRWDRYDDLVAAVQRERPHANLGDVTPLTDRPDAAATPAQAEPSSQQPAGTVIHIHGDVTGSAIGGGSVQAENIAGRDIIIGAVPKDKEEFNQQLKALKALLEQAIAEGEFEEAREGETAVADLQDVVEEVQAEEPRAGRMSRRLKDVSETLEKAAGAATAAGKVGAAVLKAAPIVAALVKAVGLLF